MESSFVQVWATASSPPGKEDTGMQFEYDNYGPSFSALTQPYSTSITLPQTAPTAMFSGSIPAVHFAPVEPIHASQVVALHGPMFQTLYCATLARPHTQPALVHPVVLGSHCDR